MAQENIEIAYPNFCIGPQAGTIATVDTSEASTRLIIKNFAGSVINTYTLSSNILNTVVGVEYTGPRNLSQPITGTTFFTCERISSSSCMVKRWELDTSFSTLNLKQTIILSDSFPHFYDVTNFAVENYEREFNYSNPGGINYLQINNTSRLSSGTKLFLGPSTDADNEGATEVVTVNYIVGNTVYLNSNIINQYVVGDSISFYNRVYLISDKGYAGTTNNGSIIGINPSSGSVVSFADGGEYQNVSAARWSNYLDSITLVKSTQALFVRPYTSWLKFKSMYLNNVSSSNANILPVYDIAFDGNTVYKLMRAATYRNDVGDKITYTWSTYNYQLDSLLPYTSSVQIYTDKSVLPPNTTTTLYIKVTDQFGVGLLGVNINFYKIGDPGSEFDPLNGQTSTDSNGEGSIDYTSGFTYDNVSEVTVRADGGSVSATGSQYIWNLLRIFSDYEIEAFVGEGYTPPDSTKDGRGAGLTQIGYISGSDYIEPNPGWIRFRQIYPRYKTSHYKRGEVPSEIETTYPPTYIICKSYFTAPAGEEGGATGDWATEFVGNYDYDYFPFAYQEDRIDGPPTKGTWEFKPWEDDPAGVGFNRRASYVKQIGTFNDTLVPGSGICLVKETEYILKQPFWFWHYYHVKGEFADLEDGEPIPISVVQIGEMNYTLTSSGICAIKDSDLQMSQLKLSAHTHYVDGDPYDELWTYVDLNQVLFVVDAIPAFWSEKNSRDTSIWIRIRPFGFDFNVPTFKFYIREVWTEDDIRYDTGYYDITNDGTITFFDAGGGLEGINFYYEPPERFHHNAIVYVHLEIYDQAPTPNFITTDYWFKIIPDYNRPYLVNLSPDREENQVPIDTEVYFEIKDDGAGIDIETLEVFINSRTLTPTTITEVSKYHYKVNCELSKDLQYGKTYTIGVKVLDLSENRNALRDSYRFYTAESDAPWFTGFNPVLCKRGMPKFTDVSFLVLGSGSGIDRGTVRLQVQGIDVTNKSNIIPVIYRIS